MNKYREYNKECEKKVNNFPMMFAFSKGQFLEVLKKLGVSEDEVMSIGLGGYIRKRDEKAFEDLMNSMELEKITAIKEDDDFVVQMFEYEMGNHEYCINGDDENIAHICGLSINEIIYDERLSKLYKQAKKNYLRGVK